MQGKLSAADWKRIEVGLQAALNNLENMSTVEETEFEATLDRIQFHNKTGVYALKLVR